jgi:hypothetical protein
MQKCVDKGTLVSCLGNDGSPAIPQLPELRVEHNFKSPVILMTVASFVPAACFNISRRDVFSLMMSIYCGGEACMTT